MQVLDSGHQLLNYTCALLLTEVPLVLDQIEELLPLAVLHHYSIVFLVAVGLIKLHNVRVVRLHHHQDLLLEHLWFAVDLLSRDRLHSIEFLWVAPLTSESHGAEVAPAEDLRKFIHKSDVFLHYSFDQVLLLIRPTQKLLT